MFWIIKLHYSGNSGSHNLTVVEDPNGLSSPESIARKAIENFGVDDIKHIEVVPVPDKHLRKWHSFDVQTSLVNHGG